MTPELRAAVDRARRAYDNLWSAYNVVDDRSDESLCTLHAMIQADLRALAAEHPADDDEPVTLDFMESVVPEDGSITIATHGEVGRVYLDEGYVADGIEIKDREQLRYLLKGLGR